VQSNGKNDRNGVNRQRLNNRIHRKRGILPYSFSLQYEKASGLLRLEVMRMASASPDEFASD
jgi:hypothetical protein